VLQVFKVLLAQLVQQVLIQQFQDQQVLLVQQA
jgi:hypothetical protein